MPARLYETDTQNNKDREGRGGISIVSGIVVNNCDLVAQGMVLVRIPAYCQEVWARLTGIGAGPDGGFQYVPRIDDEVLIALNQSDLTDAFVIGGVWNNQDRAPVSDPLRLVSTRVIKTGLGEGPGHEIEFDDGVGQSITITTSTKQTIKLGKEKIEISTTGGSVSVTLDLAKQTVSIQAANIEIGGSKTAQIKLAAKNIEIGGPDTVTTSVQGKMVRIN